MNIDRWLRQNDSRRYEERELKRSQDKAEKRSEEMRRIDREEVLNSSGEYFKGIGLSDNDGW